MPNRDATPSLTWSRAVLAIAGSAFLGSLLVGCSSGASQCASGSTSAVGAVEEFLGAAAASDAERACVVTTSMDPAALDALLEGFADLSDGDSDAVVIKELPELQMGSGLVVEVTSPHASDPVQFEVVHSGGRYVVSGPDFPDRVAVPGASATPSSLTTP